MDESYTNNRAELRGVLAAAPAFSHTSRGERFYVFPLETRRLSGTADTINVIARESLLRSAEVLEAGRLYVAGELRSFNNKSGVGAKLVISLFAREIAFDEGEDMNYVSLEGTVCKPPTLRCTPLGREIADLLLAVNRPYGKSDYIPCICWGRNARFASAFRVGEHVQLIGRIQSREYMKKLSETETEKRTAYEVSVSKLECCED